MATTVPRRQDTPAQDKADRIAEAKPLIGWLLSGPAWLSDQLRIGTDLGAKNVKTLRRTPAQKLLLTIGLLGVIGSSSNYHVNLQGLIGHETKWSVSPTRRSDVQWRPGAIVPPVKQIAKGPTNWVIDITNLTFATNVAYWQFEHRPTIWNTAQGGLFWLGFGGTLCITCAQGLFLRRTSYAVKVMRFGKDASKKKVVAPEDAIAKAKVSAAQVNNHGIGSIIGYGALAVAGWGFEFWMGGNALQGSAFPDSSQRFLNCFVAIGPELAWALSTPVDD
ncbi:hypothetical protein D0962_23065 [Leptolyngbyaceae cyanobacterium CCMR0082]|uniref:Uncharacterized protein n=1 Tax=Adonisia turfae CCMR0082 TaxID=2304604 RepID=A0A6M0SC80_9CYAN|nr:hypothetical protein [Adonisia turfae]NEZ65601.1 hypothetical protein [Adonisia turfae CCMR0082]